MLNKILIILRYGILLFKFGGIKVFFQEFKRHINSTTISIGVEQDLNDNIVPVQSKVKYSLRQASEDDMKEVFQKIKTESKRSTIELIRRKFFYDSGFRNCYIARTIDTNDLCYVEWVLTSKDNNSLNCHSGCEYPLLRDDEVCFEYRYTFEKYRGNRIAPSVDLQLSEMFKKNGFKRQIGYVSTDNIAAMKASEIAGDKPFETVRIRRLLFFKTRKQVAIEPLLDAQ
jgi:hypothetical protein